MLEIDAASNTGIDNIREVLENAQYAPTMGSYKVYIIDEVHMLSKSAFNAMLKTLEEPPEHVKFILATTDPQKVPVTVLSRCLQFVLRNLNTAQVYDHLVYVLQHEQIAYEDTALQLLGRAAAGSMRDALSLLDQAIAIGSGKVTETDVRNMIGAVDKSYLYALLQALAERDGQALLAQANEMTNNAIGFDGALTELALLLQRLSLLQTIPTAIQTDDPEYTALSHLAKLFSPEQIQLYYQCALRGKADLPLAPDENAGFIMTLLRMLAFAPLAALAEQRVHGQIAGTTLQNNLSAKQHFGVRIENTDTDLSVAQNVTAPPLAMSETGSSSIAQPSTDKHHSQSTELSNIQSATEISAESTINAEPQAVPDELEAEEIIDSPASALPTQEIISQAQESEPQQMNNSAESIHLSADEKNETEPQDLSIEEKLPPLNAENWPEILAKLAPRLGAVQLFSQHSAIADFDDSSGCLTIALAEQGEPTANRELLIRLAESLSAAYGKPIQINTCGWSEQTELETPVMRQQRLREQAQQQAQSSLESEPYVQKIIETFDASWITDSLQLREQ